MVLKMHVIFARVMTLQCCKQCIARYVPKYRRYSVRTADTVPRYFFGRKVPSTDGTFISTNRYSVLLFYIGRIGGILVPFLYPCQGHRNVQEYIMCSCLLWHAAMMGGWNCMEMMAAIMQNHIYIKVPSIGTEYRVPIWLSTEYLVPSTDC